MRRKRWSGILHARPNAGLKVWAFALVVLLGIAASTVLGMRPLTAGGNEVDEVRHDDQTLVDATSLRVTLAEWQFYIEPYFAKFSTLPLAIDPVDLSKGSKIADVQVGRVQTLADGARSLGLSGLANNLERSQRAFLVALTALAPLASGRPDDVRATTIAAERASFAQLWLLTSTVSAAVSELRDVDSKQADRHLRDGRTTVLAVGALTVIAVLWTAWLVGRRARRKERVEHEKVERHLFETTLRRALEMAERESDAYGVANQALEASVPELQVEMLLADSSRAHFHQTLATEPGPDPRVGCGVTSPLLCPAAKRGHTMLFPSSRAIDACPYLHGRVSGECSAACVAVSVAGNSIGVLHATGVDTSPPTESELRYLEVTARQTSERIAMLRAFEKSETQARSDPLTGLLNRRSLENQVNDLERSATPYSLAYGDLDHFKVLNDTHGHEAGDQALRLFSRVLRDSVRPDDIVARYGGEEFVIVLPDCTVETATAVLERLRERLALALTNGRVPAFTVSFGLAGSSAADTFDDVVALADHALLTAKSEGRNRVVLATEATESLRAEQEPVEST